MVKQYQFGHTAVEVSYEQEISFPLNWKQFECESKSIQRKYELKFTDNLIRIENEFRSMYPEVKEINRKDVTLLLVKEKECRILRFAGESECYAISIEENEFLTRVWIHVRAKAILQYDAIFGSLFSFERLMMKEQALILHSAYMCRDGKAILFSAPSETGKSTQANLWEKYRGTKTINGDRSLLLHNSDGWYAYGWPICGSSEICYNENYPIKAIVMLYQAKENVVKRLGMADAMKKVIPQITINMWDTEFQLCAIDLITQLISEVPVYELGCDISESAVVCLESVLNERG